LPSCQRSFPQAGYARDAGDSEHPGKVARPDKIGQTDEIQVYDATINAPGQFNVELHNSTMTRRRIVFQSPSR
jgi:hypothetical protein